MGKTSPLSGTGKKALKQVHKAAGFQAKQAVKEAKAAYPYKKGALHGVKQFAKGRHLPEYKGKSKYEPSKFKPKAEYEPSKFKPKTEFERSSLGKLQKDFARAGEGLEPLFAQRKQAALADFAQNVAPQIATNAGAAGSSKSSAVRQAIAGAQGNLSRNLSADFESMRNNIATNLLGERERQKQFGAQFGAGQEQFHNQLRNQQQQFGAQFGAGQEQFGAGLKNQQQQFGANFAQGQEQNLYNSQLHALQAKLNANQMLLGNPVQANFSPLQGNYNPPAGQKGPGMGAQLIGGGLGALGGFAGTEAGAGALAGLFGGGAAAGGAGGAAAALPLVAASSQEIKENIREYEKGLETIRDLEVKQYDYNIPVEGRSNDRVGLIAEDVPEEIQAMIGDIKAVDVYALVGLLVNCVKQLDIKVKELEAQNV